MPAYHSLPPLAKIAEALGGEIKGLDVLAPGPGHSSTDRSMSVRPGKDADIIVHSFAGDDPAICRDYVRKKLNLPEPTKKDKADGSGKAWKLIAEHIYRDEKNEPYLRVRKCLDEKGKKQYPQSYWDGGQWVKGKPKGPKIPYLLSQLLATPLTTTIYLVEGEKDADSLAKLGFVATTTSEGAAAKWAKGLTPYFKDRHVIILPDSDKPGRKHANKVAKAINGVAASLKVVDLFSERTDGSDVSNYLETDRVGAKFIKLCKDAPYWDPAADDHAGDDDAGDGDDEVDKLTIRLKQADVLIALASAAELFHDLDDVGFARFGVNGHFENWPLRSKGFKRWLVRAYYESERGAPNAEAMNAALGVLEAHAQFDAPEQEVHVRVAGHDGSIYVDLVDPDWRVIEIDEDGWRVIDDPPVRFRRSAGMKALPQPIAGGSLETDLRPLCNVKTDNEFVLAVAWLLAALRDRGPYPVLGVTGEQGSAKSMLCNILRALVDPNAVLLRALPRNEHDVYISARNSHVQAVDNASGLPDWLSDAYCRLSTGGGFSTRELYTDQDEILFGGKRPVLLNGIDDIATRPDLADRSIVLTLGAVSDGERKLESDLWEQFERKRPRFLGVLLDAVSNGLQILPDLKLDRLPRMADFAKWITACEGALWPKGVFLTAYTGNITEAIEVVLEASQVATALRTYMDLTFRFEGSASDLLKALNGTIPESQQKAKGWPKRPNTLSGILRRIAPPLRKVGIEITFEREGKSRVRTITITHTPSPPDRVRKTSSSSSASSASSDINDLGRTINEGGIVRLGAEIVRLADGADDQADDPDTDIVRHNPLINNKVTDADDADDLLHILKTEHRCAQCHGPPDGKERLVVVDGKSVWLHPECEWFFVREGRQW
jgi:hypothetical protein